VQTLWEVVSESPRLLPKVWEVTRMVSWDKPQEEYLQTLEVRRNLLLDILGNEEFSIKEEERLQNDLDEVERELQKF